MQTEQNTYMGEPNIENVRTWHLNAGQPDNVYIDRNLWREILETQKIPTEPLETATWDGIKIYLY